MPYEPWHITTEVKRTLKLIIVITRHNVDYEEKQNYKSVTALKCFCKYLKLLKLECIF